MYAIHGARILIESLIEQGVDTVFGYPGGAMLFVYDELYKHKDRIRHVLTSHEQHAAHAADGYARSTGKVGVFGGLPVPAATIYMDGFVQGVAHYNTQQNRQVEALGWSQETQDGTFVRSTTDPWNDPDAGRAAAASIA